ncbi:unnamed protein product [Rotaria socialis]|uniref:Uncharacterized protein n=1 Tax=Rotaria socialis TaxID=392032 RepID=A0A821AKF0_9BILA|nr:unnamed protein product [Rotaria socialis]
MEICMVNREEKSNPRSNNMYQENSDEFHSNIDHDCLRKYDENNGHFSMGIIFENQEGEQQRRSIGYSCIYRYGTHRIKLEYDIENNIWVKIPLESNEEQENIIDSLFNNNEDIRSLFQSFTLDQQIELIIKRYDKHFAGAGTIYKSLPVFFCFALEIDRMKKEQEYESKILLSPSIFTEVNPLKILENDFIELSLLETSEALIAHENDEKQNYKNDSDEDFVDFGLHSLITGSRPKFSGLVPPPVAPRRSRQNSAFSQSSVRYASFIPPSTAPIRRRRVIESIHLHVERKKKLFEKIIDILKGIESPTMYQLGLEFLRIYDGKFNYPERHKFDMHYRKKTWFLTIEKITCVDCPAGDNGPRSLLLLEYKGQYTRVHM